MDDTELTDRSHDEVFITAVLFESALAAVALLLGWILGPSARSAIPKWEFENVWPIVSGLLYGALAAIPILVLIAILRRVPWEPIRELERLTDEGMFKTLMELRPAELIVISICAGVGEELLFRGWLLHWFADGLVGVATGPTVLGVALIASSLVFGLFHPVTPLYIALATLMGIYFGALLIYTENLLVPIAAHATYDAVQLIMSARSEASAKAT